MPCQFVHLVQQPAMDMRRHFHAICLANGSSYSQLQLYQHRNTCCRLRLINATELMRLVMKLKLSCETNGSFSRDWMSHDDSAREIIWQRSKLRLSLFYSKVLQVQNPLRNTCDWSNVSRKLCNKIDIIWTFKSRLWQAGCSALWRLEKKCPVSV